MLLNGNPKKKESDDGTGGDPPETQKMAANNPIRRWLQRRAVPRYLHCVDCGERFSEKGAFDVHVVKHQILDICYQIQESEDMRFERLQMEKGAADGDFGPRDHPDDETPKVSPLEERRPSADEEAPKEANGVDEMTASPPAKRTRMRTLSDSSSEEEGAGPFEKMILEESDAEEDDDESREALKMLAEVSAAVETPPRSNGAPPPSLLDTPKIFDVLSATVTRNSYNPNGQENSGYTFAPIARPIVAPPPTEHKCCICKAPLEQEILSHMLQTHAAVATELLFQKGDSEIRTTVSRACDMCPEAAFASESDALVHVWTQHLQKQHSFASIEPPFKAVLAIATAENPRLHLVAVVNPI
ncbi:hypothetical protein QR680_009474 [Steinernema hermaphroditum]|uniref:C2H2-type domain-containing protein n=1 Tax=Steinernema hermaphroditum TaxID=289476 RepID=A0AA39M8X2_9BILA|nr:hypothetical protein QR680_009474 [Steinernema hermaphroditum]